MKVIDMHCDTISGLFALKEQGKPEGLRQNNCHIDLLRMKQSRYLIQNFALFVPLKRVSDPWEQVCSLYRLYQEELERNRDILAPVLCFSDIQKNEAEGKLSSLLTVEEGGVCKGELEKLRKLYQMGVRMMTLTWNFDNEIGHPNLNSSRYAEHVKKVMEAWKNCDSHTPAQEREEKRQAAEAAFTGYYHTPNQTGGLTGKGREMVAEMEKLGMIPDVSHLSDAGFYDVLRVTRKPFVASHSNARAVCPCVRNMTDDMIRKLSERGGVMGLNFCADFLEEKSLGEKNPGTIAAVVRHAKHIVSVGGIEVLGLGSDFDGIHTHEELPGAQSMDRLWSALCAAGFSEDQAEKIFWRNVLRVYQDTL
nr:dipeptidase [uncultured Acetatifactor sp.]